MEKQIIELGETGKAEPLVKELNALQPLQLSALLNSVILKGRGDPLAFLRSVILGSPVNCVEGSDRLLNVYAHIIQILLKNEINSKLASNLVGILMMEADCLPGSVLVPLAGQFLEMVRDGSLQSGSNHDLKVLDLFPKILSVVSDLDTVVNADNSTSGSEFKSHILNTICSCKWKPHSILPLAAMFRDVILTMDELQFVISKILRGLYDLDLEDLPALVYQLLLLAAKGHKRLVLEGIAEFFIDQDNKQRNTMESEDLMCEYTGVETLRHTEGTIILHVVFAFKQDQDLGREFIKYLKASQLSSPTRVLAPFNLALALSLGRVHRFEDQIFDFLKTTILRCYKDNERQQSSYIVREITQQSVNIEQLVLETVSNSIYGWDHVIQSLVQLGFTLLDSFGPKAAFGRVESVSINQTSPMSRSCKLGSQILINTFKAHEVVRPEILDQIFNRVITKATSPVSHYLDLLADTVKSAPVIVLECVPKVREAFDYLSFLPVASAEGLLKAVQPLLKLSISLRDSLMLVLRKAMFSKQPESRKIGVLGFLLIVKHFKILGGIVSSQSSQPFSLSQIQVDVHRPYNAASNEALCLEILGNLRRCCTQQADVRLQLYEGLYDVLCRNSKLQAPVLDMMLTQINRYYETDPDVVPPLKLEPCIVTQGESVYLSEPLGHLLSCIQLCVVKTRQIYEQMTMDSCDEDVADEDGDAALSELETFLDTLADRMIITDMEDFELDKSADFSLATSVGVKNNIYAILVMGVYEVLMEYVFVKGKLSEASCEKVYQLYSCYQKLCDTLKERTSAAAGKKGRTAASKTPHSLLSFGTVVKILDTLLSYTDDSITVLRCPNFLNYIASTATQKLQQLSDKGTCDGAVGLSTEKKLAYCYTLARVMMRYYVENQVLTEEAKKDKKKNVCAVCLDGIIAILSYVCHQGIQELCQCLCNIDEDCKGETVKAVNKPEKIHSHIKKFQRLVINIVSADEDVSMWKEVTSLLTMMSLLTKYLPTDGSVYEQVHSWLFKLCTDQNIGDLNVSKQLLCFLIDMTQQMKNLPQLLRDLAQDVHSQLGDIDQEVEVDDKTHFAMVTHRTASVVLSTMLVQTERELDNLDWCISWVKADILSNQKKIDAALSQGLTQREGHEKAISLRLGVLVTAFHELIQTVVPYGAVVEAILKSLTHLYTSCTNFVKYYISMYSNKTGHVTARFEKLVKLTGKELTQNVYPFITYIQTCENEQFQQAADKNKKGKKAVPQAGKSQASKQAKTIKTIPNLIFAIEQFERYLIQLTKKSKINLMEYIKLSTSRDFRISSAAVQAVMEEEASTSDESEDENQEPTNEISADEDAPPPKKKTKANIEKSQAASQNL